MEKKILKNEELFQFIHDGMSIMIGGFLNAPNYLVDALVAKGVKDLTIISNDTNFENQGVGKLIHHHLVKKIITTHIGTNPETQRKMLSGELEVEIVPMGTLVERVRAGGSGLGGFLTPTGVGTLVAEGKQVIEVNGQSYLLELPLRADLALLQASVADRAGNLFHRKATRNWNPIMAMACDLVIAEAEQIVEIGELAADIVHTPGVFVDYLFQPEQVQGGMSHG